jgi:hypothetical protein
MEAGLSIETLVVTHQITLCHDRKNTLDIAQFEVLMVVNMKVIVLWDVA